MGKKIGISDLVRSDGKLAYSFQGKRLAETRLGSTKGRVQKALGEDDTFTRPFKEAVLADHDHILERIHLETELLGAKKVIRALSSPKASTTQTEILKRIRTDPTKRRSDCILCPFWRNANANDLTNASVSRYLFPEKSHEVFLPTIVFGFAENLEALADQFDEANDAIKTAEREMSRREMGLLIFGAFEPDLKTNEELHSPQGDPHRLMNQLGKVAPVAGGWVLSGHFIVRAPRKDVFLEVLDKLYPSVGWQRIQFRKIDEDKTMAANVMDIMGYVAKYPEPIFGFPTRGSQLKAADQHFHQIKAAFSGPSVLTNVDQNSFDVAAAIRQWAEFVDHMGPKRMMVSIETRWAQRWYSQSECQYIRATDLDLVGETDDLIEPHRGREFYYTGKNKPSIVGKMRYLRTRPLKYDHEWYVCTDISEADPFTSPVSLDGRLYRK